MTAPLLTKIWNVSANVRKTPFVSLLDTSAWWMYQNKAALVAAGWIVKFSCDGTTGPTNGADSTDRWGTQAGATIRAAVDAAAQSWIVLQNTDGVQLMFDYQGATDDIFRISYSIGGVFTLAAPTTNRPTASDEEVIISATSLVGATASLDRVGTIWCSTDTKSWASSLFRAGAQTSGLVGLWHCTSLCAPGIFGGNGSTERPYVAFRWSGFSRATSNVALPTGGCTLTVPGTAGYLGAFAKVFTVAAARRTRVGGGDICLIQAGNNNASGYVFWNADKPALQGGLGSPLLPIYWSGEKGANLDGLIGIPIDAWQMYTASGGVPAFGDFVPGYEPGDTIPGSGPRTNWLVAIGSMWVMPWKNAGASLENT